MNRLTLPGRWLQNSESTKFHRWRMLLAATMLATGGACSAPKPAASENPGEGFAEVSQVDGKAYHSELDFARAARTGVEDADPRPNVNRPQEPAGTISLNEAIRRADRVAAGLLGTRLTGPNPTWVMDKAERTSRGYSGCYYYVHYLPRRMDKPRESSSSFLSIIVYLDGTVQPLRRV